MIVLWRKSHFQLLSKRHHTGSFFFYSSFWMALLEKLGRGGLIIFAMFFVVYILFIYFIQGKVRDHGGLDTSLSFFPQRIWNFIKWKFSSVLLPTHTNAFRAHLSVRQLSFAFRDEKPCSWYLESSVWWKFEWGKAMFLSVTIHYWLLVSLWHFNSFIIYFGTCLLDACCLQWSAVFTLCFLFAINASYRWALKCLATYMLYLKRHHAKTCENKTSVSWLCWCLEQISLETLALTVLD